MPAFQDRTGQVFSRLTVLDRAPRRGTMVTMWRCRCECGQEVVAYARNLVIGSTRSCGCLRAEVSRQLGRNRKHGMTGSRTHNAWRAAKDRCHNPRNKKYADYGGRGIAMCKEWRADFRLFAADVGEAPGPKSELDRIDTNKGYEPGNCRWATRSEQMLNRRGTTLVRLGDSLLPLREFAARCGIPYQTIVSRVAKLRLRGCKEADGLAILAAGR